MTAQPTSAQPSSSPPLIGKGWVQGVALVMIFGFLVMGILAYRTYSASMPMPDKVVSRIGPGPVHRPGHHPRPRALPGPRTAGIRLGARPRRLPRARLHRRVPADGHRRCRRSIRAQGVADPHEPWSSRNSAPTAITPPPRHWCSPTAQAAAFDHIQRHYAAYFGENSTKYGLLPHMITDPTEIHDLTAFFAWTAWAAAAERPGHDYSYTNNWPAEPRVDNGPTAQLIVWSALSLIALLGGIGIMFARLRPLEPEDRLAQRRGADAVLPPARRGGADARAARHASGSSRSFRCCSWPRRCWGPRPSTTGPICPTSSVWIWPGSCPTTWPGPGMCSCRCSGPRRPSWPADLPGAVHRRGANPDARRWLAYGLLGAVAVVVFGSLICEALSIYGVIPAGALLSQQWEYLDLPRLWQILLIVGMFLWIVIIWRGMRGRLKGESQDEHAVAVLLLRRWPSRRSTRSACWPAATTHFTVADFWRFWVVHLWVEDFLELFTTVMVAYIFVLLGVVRERIALRRHLPRHHPVLGRRRHRHDAPPVLLRDPGGAHGAGRVLLGGGGHPADLPDRRGVGVPATRLAPAVRRRASRSRTAGRSCSWSRSASGTSSAPASSGS